MFSPPPRRTPRHRQAGAALLALLLPLTLASAGLLAGTQAVELVPAEAPIEVVFPEAPTPGFLPGPPGEPAAGPAEGAPEPPPEPQEVPPPEDEGAVEDPESIEVTENPPPTITALSAALDAATRGLGSGSPQGGGGECTGPDCGGGGGCTGPDCGGGGGPLLEVDFSQVKVRHQVKPKMPLAAQHLSPGEYPCRLRFFVDERGQPADIRVESCPSVFRENALQAAWAWRFAPMRIDGAPTPAQFVLTLRYVVD